MKNVVTHSARMKLLRQMLLWDCNTEQKYYCPRKRHIFTKNVLFKYKHNIIAKLYIFVNIIAFNPFYIYIGSLYTREMCE